MWRWLQCLLTTRYGGKATGFYKPCFEKKQLENFSVIHLVGCYWVESQGTCTKDTLVTRPESSFGISIFLVFACTHSGYFCLILCFKNIF
jgi:hypothetical protein